MVEKPPGAMPRCYMVKKGAPRSDAETLASLALSSPNEAPPNRPAKEHRANTETKPVDVVAEYEELRSIPISERSAAETEAAHELLSLAAGVPPLPPLPPLPTATVLTMLPAEPVLPVYTYTLQPTTIFIVSNDQQEPMYHALQTIPLQQPINGFVAEPHPVKSSFSLHDTRSNTYSCVGGSLLLVNHPVLIRVGAPRQMVEYTTIDNHQQVSYVTYPESLPPPPPLQYQPVPSSQLIIETAPAPVNGYSGLTTDEQITDSEPELRSVQVSVIEPVPQLLKIQAQASTQVTDLDVDSDEDTLFIDTAKEKQGKYSCKECGKRYATSSNLSRHKQTHRSLDSNSAKRCDDCGKAYVSMPALAMHILTHRMGHVCGVCGKLFSRPWLLRGHVRSHTGEKPYNCEHCGKAFADRSNLRAHLQTHSSDKKYDCARCKKSFALKSYLTKHQEAACAPADDDGAAA